MVNDFVFKVTYENKRIINNSQLLSTTNNSVISVLTSFRHLEEKGLTHEQIISKMEQNGQNLSEIYKTANIIIQQGPLKGPRGHYSMAPPQNPMNFQPQSVTGNSMPPPPMGRGSPMQSPMGGMGAPPPMSNPPADEDMTQVEELIEAVIEEKWKDIERNVNKIVSWKDTMEQKISQLEQGITDLRSDYDGLQKAIIGKVGEYDKNVLEVGTQLQAMEKAFSDVLPTFTQNVNELSRISQRFKEE